MEPRATPGTNQSGQPNATPASADRREHERRRAIRLEPPGLVLVDFENRSEPIHDAEVLNLSEGGAALRSPSPVTPGERVAFNVGGGRPPVLCQVIGCERMDDGWFRVRCKCILGGFDLEELEG